jgi:hypothetical protein
VPAFWIRLAEICAVSAEVLLKRVARADPSHNTVEDGVKLEPVTVSVNAGWPARIVAGEIDRIAGVGKFICSWQQVSSTAKMQIKETKNKRELPRKFSPLHLQVDASA